MSTGGIILAFVLVVFVFGIVLVGMMATGGIAYPGGKKHESETNQRLRQLQATGFVIEKRYNEFHDKYWTRDPFLLFDFTHSLCAYRYNVFSLGKIVECSLIQDGTVVHKNAVAPAMVGAAIFGLGGALAGATAMHSDAQVGVLAVRLMLDDIRNPSVLISFLSSSVDKSSQIYLNAFQEAQEVYGIFEGVIRINERQMKQAQIAQNNAQPVSNPAYPQPSAVGTPKIYCANCGAELSGGAKFCSSCGSTVVHISQKTAEQLRKLEQLRDDGILTQQEFEEKKKMLQQ